MKTYSSLADVPAADCPVSLAVGVFDGFHRGHQQVVARAEESARQQDGETWLLTFEPNPVQILHPERTPPRLITPDLRRRLAEAQGLDGFIQHPFTPEFSHLSPEAFVEYLLKRIPTLRSLTVGANWRFGFQACGDVRLMQKLGTHYGFEVHAATPVRYGDKPISSTRIREALLTGDVVEAREMLGRCYAIAGPVVPGAQTGRRLGFPTANVAVENELIPPDGIYAVFVGIDGARLPGAGYRGESNPGGGAIFEVHLLDYQGDLYGRHIEVHFQEREREDRRFDSKAALIRQIGKDVASIRTRLAAACAAP